MSLSASLKSDPRALSHDDFDALVYIRVFEGCNLHCDHCFIPNNPKRMGQEALNSVCNELRRVSGESGRVLLQWHGGEPTALGIEYLRNALETIESTKGDLKITHGIQTNLLNYTSEWADLYREYFDGSVGVSWDYKIRKVRSSNSNDEFEDMFWPNLQKLVDDGLEPYLVITGTKLFFERYKNNPIELFETLESFGVQNLHIERLTNVGYARDNWDVIGLTNAEYSKYMSRFYKAYSVYVKNNYQRRTIRISPFDGLTGTVADLVRGDVKGGYGCLSGACDSRYHTIDANGYKFGCTAINSEYDNKRVKDDVQVIKFFDLKGEREVRQLTCEGCRYKPICSSGCMAVDKFDESQECSGASQLFSVIEKIVSSDIK